MSQLESQPVEMLRSNLKLMLFQRCQPSKSINRSSLNNSHNEPHDNHRASCQSSGANRPVLRRAARVDNPFFEMPARSCPRSRQWWVAVLPFHGRGMIEGFPGEAAARQHFDDFDLGEKQVARLYLMRPDRSIAGER